ncbi:MAG: hypothetical protein IT290_02940 [Deltaproteobacteria bacterium]|nr:hypothetical protein [Deltaproteobacteria bacterium]
MKCLQKFCVAVATTIAVPWGAALADGIVLTGTPATLHDADEYFHDVLHAPRNFNTPCDTGFMSWSYEPYGIVNGAFSGIHPSKQGGVLGILPIPTIGTNIAVFREDCGQLGLHGDKSINADKYTNISFRMQNSTPSSFSILWSKSGSDYAINGWGAYDGFYLPSIGVQPAANEWVIRDYNLPSKAPADFSWGGSVMGMSLIPSFYEPAGGHTGLDWVRVYDPSSDDSVNLSWDYTGDFQFDAYTKDYVTLHVDKDNTGYDGDVVQRELPVDGSISLGTGFLAPGTYYFYVVQDRHNINNVEHRHFSPYMGPFVVNSKPMVKITSPSRLSGKAYSRDVVGDAWDMNGPQDLSNLGSNLPQNFRHFHDWSFTDGYFMATTDQDSDNNHLTFEIDTQVHMTVSPTTPVNTKEYRYFCYKMQVDAANLPRNGDAVQLTRAGWVGRLIWQNDDIGGGFGSSAAHELVESSNDYPDFTNGFTTYCFDLWSQLNYESGMDWFEMGVAKTIRFDPLEATPATRFAIDFAELYAENRNDDAGQYQITWSASDPESDPVSMDLYYGTDPRGLTPGVLIAHLNAGQVAAGTYTWDASSIPQGTYFITAVASDGRNSSNFVSDVPVHINQPPPPPPTPAPRRVRDPVIGLTSLRPTKIFGSGSVRLRARLDENPDIASVTATLINPKGKRTLVSLPVSTEANVYVLNRTISHSKGRKASKPETWTVEFKATNTLGVSDTKRQRLKIEKYKKR